MFQSFENIKNFIWRMAFLMAAGLFVSSVNSFAGDAAITIKEIKEPSALNLGAPIDQQEPVQTYYFAKGTVDAKGDNWITINDHQFIIAPDVNLGCGVGDFVGIQVNDERKVVSCKRIKK